MAVLGCSHLRSVPANKRGPLGWSPGILPKLHRFDARRQVGEPDVVPVLARERSFGNATRRTTNRSDTEAFVLRSWRAKSYNADNHRCSS